MKTLYIECGMGAAGDMLTAALLELLSDEQKQAFLEKVNYPRLKSRACENESGVD